MGNKLIQDVREFVSGKSIAMVANSQSLFLQSFENDIDSHDIVVRFNKGFELCNNDWKRMRIGSKTTILVVANSKRRTIEEKEYPPNLRRILWIDWWPTLADAIPKYVKEEKICPVWYYTGQLWKQVSSELGGYKPSSGTMMFDLLLRAGTFSHLSMFGFDFWKHPSSTHNRNQGVHNPKAEKNFFRKKCAEFPELDIRYEVYADN